MKYLPSNNVLEIDYCPKRKVKTPKEKEIPEDKEISKEKEIPKP